MIDRAQLGLTEITQAEYVSLMASRGMLRNQGYSAGTGFVRITRPLEFDSYPALLNHFRKTEHARRVSTQLPNHEWLRYEQEDLLKAIPDEFVKAATANKSLYVSFFNRNRKFKVNGYWLDNEIDFGLMPSGHVMSLSLIIPGDEMDLYNWQGPNRPYLKIRGVYVPDPVADGNPPTPLTEK